jgi:hypothetical protein
MNKRPGTITTPIFWVMTMWMCTAIGAQAEGAITNALPEQSGAPAHSIATPHSVAPPLQANDREAPLAQAPAVVQPSAADMAKRATTSANASVARLTIVERLSALRSTGRTDAFIEVQVSDITLPPQKTDAQSAERLWNTGDIERAITMLEQLEAAGALAGVAVNWIAPQEAVSESERGVDVRIGENPGEYLTGATRTALDFHTGTGNAYAIVAWGDMWTVERSPNMTTTWFETSRFITTGEITDLDAAVVGDYLYINYIDTAAGTYGARMSRVRRCHVASGAQDFDYGTAVIGDAGFGNTMTEVSVCSNADEFDDRVYVFQLDSTGKLHYYYATDTAPYFTGLLTPVTNALGGLDAAFGTFNTIHFLYVSYIASGNELRVLRRSDLGVWDDQFVREFSGYNIRTSISGWQSNIIYAFEEWIGNDYGIRYVISYDSGDNWNWGALAAPLPGESFFAMADVTARGGVGTAAVYQQDAGTQDKLLFRKRPGYATGLWADPLEINDWYTMQDTWTTINWLPPLFSASDAYGYGMLYMTPSRSVYFDRLDGAPGNDCDDPIVFSVPGDLPYASVESTCGRVDDYNETAMGYFDGGEDIIYRMNVTSASTVTIDVLADTDWAGVGVFSSAPPSTDNCIAQACSDANPDVIENLHLDTGVYYIMIDTWPFPQCADFTLNVTLQPATIVPDGTPAVLALGSATPNPFNPRMTIWMDLPQTGDVTLAVHELRGRLVRKLVSGRMDAGRHPVIWDGTDDRGHQAASGVYLVRLVTSDGGQRTAKVTLTK